MVVCLLKKPSVESFKDSWSCKLGCETSKKCKRRWCTKNCKDKCAIYKSTPPPQTVQDFIQQQSQYGSYIFQAALAAEKERVALAAEKERVAVSSDPSDPVVSLGNFLKVISEAELPAKEDTTVNIFWRCIPERKSCDFGTNEQKEAKWIINTIDAPNKKDVDLVEDFYEYLVDGWEDEFSVYTGNSIFKSPTFPTKIRNKSWAGGLKASPPTTEQKIIIQQMNTYKGLVESGKRFKPASEAIYDQYGRCTNCI
jgi:hypothetical protein